MREEIHRLVGSAECKQAIKCASLSEPINAKPDDTGGWQFFDGAGRLIGKVTRRHKLASALAGGSTIVHHCSVNSVTPPCDQYPNGKVNVRITLGAAGEVYEPPVVSLPGSYTALIAGVSNYQDAIRRCREGDHVYLFHEVDNPHDDHAIVVKTIRGERIGYLPRNDRLGNAIHRYDLGATASILSLHTWSGPTGVILHAVVNHDPIGKSSYSEPQAKASDATSRPPPSTTTAGQTFGCLVTLVIIIALISVFSSKSNTRFQTYPSASQSAAPIASTKPVTAPNWVLR